MEAGTGAFQKDLAKRIGVSEMTIVNWEKGRTKPTKKNLKKLNINLNGGLEPEGKQSLNVGINNMK